MVGVHPHTYRVHLEGGNRRKGRDGREGRVEEGGEGRKGTGGRGGGGKRQERIRERR